MKWQRDYTDYSGCKYVRLHSCFSGAVIILQSNAVHRRLRSHGIPAACFLLFCSTHPGPRSCTHLRRGVTPLVSVVGKMHLLHISVVLALNSSNSCMLLQKCWVWCDLIPFLISYRINLLSFH